jgi:hypothetical protein
LQAIEVGHHYVQQDEVDVLIQACERRTPVSGYFDCVFPSRQHLLD